MFSRLRRPLGVLVDWSWEPDRLTAGISQRVRAGYRQLTIEVPFVALTVSWRRRFR